MRRIQGWIAVALLAALMAAIVTGCGSDDETAEAERQPDPAAVEAAQRKAMADYAQYLDAENGVLLKWVQRLEDDIARGDHFSAGFRYNNSRVHFGHVRPAAYLFEPRETQINDTFHEIERAIFGKQTTKGVEPAAKRLVAQVRQLGREFEGAEMQPLELAEAGQLMMSEASGRMVEGKEDPNSGMDFLDVTVTTEGTEKAYLGFKPLVESQDQRLVRQLDLRFLESFELLAGHGDVARLNPTPGPEAGSNFIPYADFDEEEKRVIKEPLDLLEKHLGEAAQLIREP